MRDMAIEQGKPGDEVLFMVSGSCQVLHALENMQTKLCTCDGGNVFGEEVLFERERKYQYSIQV